MLDLSPFSVIILTYNEEKNIRRCLESVLKVTSSIFVVDSFSTDTTLDILGEYNITYCSHEFKNYAAQRNWAQSNNPFLNKWVLHLDAGEYLSRNLINWLKHDLDLMALYDGYMFNRKITFLGKKLKYGGLYPTYHLRLYKATKGNCEKKVYDQHFVVQGKKKAINLDIVDNAGDNLKEYISKHVKWATFEAFEQINVNLQNKGNVSANIWGSPIERRRWFKEKIFQKTPPFIRSIFYFIYRYFLRGGFIDGKPGLIYHFLQALWFRFYIDSIVYEVQQKQRKGRKISDIALQDFNLDLNILFDHNVNKISND